MPIPNKPKTKFKWDKANKRVVEIVTTTQEVSHDPMDAKIQLVQLYQDQDAIAAKIAKLEEIVAASKDA